MLREIRWKFLERFCTMYKISESYKYESEYTLSFNHIMIMAKQMQKKIFDLLGNYITASVLLWLTQSVFYINSSTFYSEYNVP